MGTSRTKGDQREAGGEGLRLARQQSLLSLTLDEFQNAVRGPGKSLGSMNMDEFLTNIWSTEEGNEQGQEQGQGQPPPAVGGKTVEEVWSDIQWQPPEAHRQGMPSSQRQPTLGEMTLEDFLVKAGVVREGVGPGAQLLPRSAGMPVKQVPLHAPNLQQQQDGYGWTPRSGNGPGRIESPASPDSSETLDRPGWGRKRGLDGPVEKVVERRQRRMMKNRESAARSRARKQAYTVELEKELSFLKEENARLKDEQRKSAEWRRQTLVESMAEESKANLRKEVKSGRPGIRLCRSCLW